MQVSISWRGLQNQLPNLKDCVSKVDSLLPEIQSIPRGLSFNANSTAQIEAQLSKVSAQVKSCRDSLFQLQNAAEKIAYAYCACEQFFVRNENTRQEAVGSNGKTVASFVGAFGLAGKMVDSIYGLSVGGTASWKSVVKIVENGAKTVQRMADGKLIDIFGTFAVGKKIDEVGNFVYESPSIFKELKKYVYDPSKCSTVAAKNASKVAVAAKWVSLAFSGLLNFNNNFKEFDGDLNSMRMYEETVVETTIDVGTGIVIGTLGAFFVGASAPVWTAGVAAVGITSVCNIAVEWYEADKGLKQGTVKEVVSDTVVNAYEFAKIAKERTFKATEKFVGKAISETADCISVGWKKLKSLF